VRNARALRFIVLVGAFALGELVGFWRVRQELAYLIRDGVSWSSSDRYVFAFCAATSFVIVPVLSVFFAEGLMKRYNWPTRD
jgi:hypothetical protein